jgi:DNA-binding GntR family transcriptional regulator
MATLQNATNDKNDKNGTSDIGSLVDGAYQGIRRRILDNVWAPGYTALEQEIALELGMSRTPVREALIRLAQESLVEVVPRRGMRVLPVSPTDMKEIYEILTALESMAVELLAARKPSETELKPLITATNAMEKALQKNDLDAWAAADELFHERLVGMAGNKKLHDSVMSFWDRAHRARIFTLRLRQLPVNSTKEHMAMVDCIRRGDAVGAAAVNREHRQRAGRELLAIFEKYRFQQM